MPPLPLAGAQPLARPNYFDGQDLRAADLTAERTYLDTLRKLYNSELCSSGIAAGLTVTPGEDLRSVRIGAGLAIQPSGQEARLTTDVLIATPNLGGVTVDLFIVSTPVRSDASQTPLEVGYKRLEHRAAPFFASAGENVDPESVFLGQVVLSTTGEVSAIQTMGRQACGFAVGDLSFVDPADGVSRGGFSVVEDDRASVLTLDTPGVQVNGSLQVAGGLHIGTATPRATLDVEGVEAVLLRLTDQGGGAVLTVQNDSRSSFGSVAPDPTARLTIGGDLEIDASHAVTFAGSGRIEAASPSTGLSLGGASTGAAGTGLLQIASSGRIDLFAGASPTGAPAGAPTLTLAATGKVGVGISDPGQALVIDGSLRCLSGGFDFGDGVLQTTAAISTTVGIGGIVEWWSGNGKLTLPPEFVVCDGTVINDPSSPLHGQTTPNLVGRLVLGTTEFGEIGSTGGSPTHSHGVETWPVHIHSIVHTHPSVTHSTSQDLAAGDSDTTDSKCSNTDHTHPVEIVLQDGTPTSSLPNDAGIMAFSTEPSSSQPASVGLMMIMRIR